MNKTFLSIQFLIYTSFIVLDSFHIDSTYVKYLGIILCLIYAIYNKKKYRRLSMTFTLIADFFLLVINKHYELGLLSFIIVQICYLYFLGNIDNTYFTRFLIIRLSMFVVGTVLLIVSKNMSLLNELVLIYFSNLLTNAIQSCFGSNKLLTLGLILFVCCDICVGLHNISATYTVASFLMWVFYLPSQVLIVLA